MNKKINIFYVWGYGSSPDSTTLKNLQQMLPKDKYNVVTDYYAQYNPEEALIDLNRYMKEYNVDLVIGSSLGGYLAMQISGVKKIIINPCLHPEEELEKLTTVVGKMDDDNKPIYKENGEPETEEVPAVPDHIVEFYKEYIKTHNIWDNTNTEEVAAVLFGTHDEVLGDKYVNEVSEHILNIVRSEQGHHNTIESIDDYLIPEIEKIFVSL